MNVTTAHKRTLMNICHYFYLAFLLALGSSSAEEKKKQQVVHSNTRGNLELVPVVVPENTAKAFKRLNSKALLYRPVHAKDKKTPLIIFLHGSGGSKRLIESFAWSGEIRSFIKSQEGHPPVHILTPQSKGEWDPASLDALLDHTLKTTPAIDTNRIYCIGYSMGGKGTWEWAMHSPKRFAAIIPKGFIPNLSAIEKMVELPIWAMVGDKDSKPRVEGIQTMEKTLKNLGSKVVKITIFSGANHATASGASKKLAGVYTWLFSHKLPKKDAK